MYTCVDFVVVVVHVVAWLLDLCNVQEGLDLEVECAKKIIELDTLTSKDGGAGLSDQMVFTSKASFDKFWEWFSPPTK